jgi:hypothetical protein
VETSFLPGRRRQIMCEAVAIWSVVLYECAVGGGVCRRDPLRFLPSAVVKVRLCRQGKRIAGKGVIMHMHVPRLHVHRLVYVLLGAALAVGLLVSAFVRPEPMLTASTNCYGRCATTTTLSMSMSTVTYGREQVVKFSVKATAQTAGAGVPPGYINVTSGKYLCRARLFGGKGSCSPTAKALGPGRRYTIIATYTGSSAFSPSRSTGKILTVRK